MLQNCHKAHMRSSGQSIVFTSVDLHTVQEYHDKVHGDTRKLAGDQELASFNLEKRDLASSAATIAVKAWEFCVVDLRRDCGDEDCVMMTAPNAKRHRGSTSDSAYADDLDEAASMASSVVETDVDMKYLTGTSKEVLSPIIKRLYITVILSGTGLGRTNNGVEAYMTNGKLSEFDCTLLAKHRRAPANRFATCLSSKH